MERLFIAFLIGISFPATFVTHSYVALAFLKKGTSSVDRQTMDISIRIAYGLANVVLVALGNSIENAAVVGAILGLLLSVLGRSFDLPSTLFGFDPKSAWRVHVIAPVLYAGIFAVVLFNLNRGAFALLKMASAAIK